MCRSGTRILSGTGLCCESDSLTSFRSVLALIEFVTFIDFNSNFVKRTFVILSYVKKIPEIPVRNFLKKYLVKELLLRVLLKVKLKAIMTQIVFFN